MRVENNGEEWIYTKEEAGEKTKQINKKTNGKERNQKTDSFFVNKVLQKAVFEMSKIVLEMITFLIY